MKCSGSIPARPPRDTNVAVAAVLSSQFATLAAIGAYVLFGERLTRIQLYGVTSVIAGVALVSALSA